MPNPRLELALDLLKPSDWRTFELFASEFLVGDFPSLRTTASASGDRGRDGELFVMKGEPETAFQYSVTEDWAAKIRNTQIQLAENFPDVRRIVYATNRLIGARADGLKTKVWENSKVQIDLRDRSWFVERELTNPQRQVASAELITQFVEPMLVSRGVVENVGHALSDEEGRLALLHLTLDSRDADRRNLTKSCFDSLVLASLHDTSASDLKTFSEVQLEVEKLVPNGAVGQVRALVESALLRLSGKGGPVKHHKKRQGYHLSFDESQRIKDQTAEYLLAEEAIEEDLRAGMWGLSAEVDASAELSRAESKQLREGLEVVLMKRGEAFAAAVNDGRAFYLDVGQVSEDLSAANYSGRLSINKAASAILNLMEGPSELGRVHLRRMIDAYTLFAFLKTTPDVQKTMRKVFSEGDIWLDTSAILPLIAELLLDDPTERHYTSLVSAAINSGMKLYVTDGVVEEIAGHLRGCLTVSSLPAMEVRSLPFIYSMFILSGRSKYEFKDWILEIRGNNRPVDDIQEFLKYTFKIEGRSLADLAGQASVELRGAVQELWNEAHDRRRQRGENIMDASILNRLVAHDVENTVGVIEARRNESQSPMGYKTWWLTLDGTALRLRDFLKDRLGEDAPASPALSPDFLLQLLRLGPLRAHPESIGLPMAMDASRFDGAPKELLDLAEETRAKYAGMSELRIRREVRDALDSARSRVGPESQGGSRLMESRIHDQLKLQETD